MCEFSGEFCIFLFLTSQAKSVGKSPINGELDRKNPKIPEVVFCTEQHLGNTPG